MREPRVVLLTGDGRRHRYLASVLSGSVELVGIHSEEKYSPLSAAPAMAPWDVEVIARHLAERDDVEARLLGASCTFPDTELRRGPLSSVNDHATLEWVRRLEPDAIVLFGTGIVRPPLLDEYSGRLINMHLGLSPYYRGSGTNFWPLVNGQPECVGVTIHLAVAAVDAGDIYAQARPEAERGDRAHELGTRAVMSGAEALVEVLLLEESARPRARAQDTSRGQLYRRRDFSAAAVRRMWDNLDAGMVEDYLADGERRRAAFPIVERPRSAARAARS
ncbi:MAG TPA: formyl transferase [Gemmatimonadales bacterium]